ncbi:hypothetical protein [Anaerobacillus alkaliphilus]|uniref:hypothetical protein n=1 Tax=Anaerobacillus alkaliphilus TaxID=1548597 RepID=UPI001F4F83BC|nr:hypothetical protein [Anaerobacillus alkaliphilus]
MQVFVAGVLIPLIAIGVQLSPMAIGPANALFNAPPIFTVENNVHHILSTSQIVVATIIGVIVALAITFYVTITPPEYYFDE